MDRIVTAPANRIQNIKRYIRSTDIYADFRDIDILFPTWSAELRFHFASRNR